MDVALRVDGSHSIGLGHLYRTGSIGFQLLRRGHSVRCVTRTPEFAERVLPDAVTIETLPPTESETDVYGWIDDRHIDVVVSDLDPKRYENHHRFPSTSGTTVLVSDNACTDVRADIVVNGNIYAKKLDYTFAGATPELLFGPEYLILREEFQQYIDGESPWRHPPQKAIVIMGGVDKENQTPTVLDAITEFDLDVAAIIGSGYQNKSEIREKERAYELITALEDPENLPALMFDADLAVSTLGTTTYELMATGTPIVGIPDNETPIPETLDELDAAVVLPEMPGQSDLTDGIGKLVTDPDYRRRLRTTYDDLIEGNGPANICDEIERIANDQE